MTLPGQAFLLTCLLTAAVGVRAVAAVPPNDHFVQPESNRKMGALIERIYRESDPLRNPFRSSEQIPLLETQIARMVAAQDDPKRIFDVKLQLALQLLQAGRFDESLAAHEELERFRVDHNLPTDPRIEMIFLTGRAMCHLRAGETANCIANHNSDSCIFPIQGGGVHQLRAGSEGAKVALLELLAKFPGDLRARWLLNIAAMTLGEYPDGVPPRWRIDPARFASEYPLPRFPDVASATGLDVNGLAGGVVMEDFDRDGLLDIMVSAWGYTKANQLRVFRNRGDGSFEERTVAAGLEGLYGGLNMIQGDFNNDGYPDVLVLRGAWLRMQGHYPFSLLRNNGDFTFTDVTEQAGLMHLKPTQTAVWFDYNGDGWLDIFVGNESSPNDPTPCELYRNNGDGTFTECAAECGLNITQFVKGVATGDYNNDGRPDLFLSCQQGPRMLLRNDGPAGGDASPRAPWKFTDVTEAAGISGPTHSFPCWFWDYDNDGWLDIFVTGYSIQDVGDLAADYLGRPHPGQKARLYHNNHDGTFSDVSRAAGVNRLLHAMGANFGDLDNDGWLDFYVGTGDPDFTTLMPNRMFRNDRGRVFQDVTTAGGFGQLQKGHGIAFGDLNNDGTQEVFSKVGGAIETDNYASQVFANPLTANHWIKLELEGVQSNRVALGARIKVVFREGGVERAVHRVVGTGGSFGANPLRQEIGLGPDGTDVRVEIFWPVTGRTQVLTGLERDHAYHIREDATAAQPLTLPRFAFPAAPADGAHHHHHHHDP